MCYLLPVRGSIPEFIRNMSRGKSYDSLSEDSKGNFTTIDGMPVRKLYVNNFPNFASREDLLRVFSKFGLVSDLRIIQSLKHPKPFAFVTFQTPAEASRVLRQRSRLQWGGKKLFISPADSWHQPRDPNSVADEEENAAAANENQAGCSNTYEIDDSCPVSKLNDDCLRLIFNEIPLDCRVDLHKVCRRWESVILDMWSSVRKLDFSTSPFEGYVLTDTALEEFLHLCPNLTSINIASDDHRLTNRAIVSIAKNCPNLEEITMRNLQLKRRSFAVLAKSCPKLKSFTIESCIAGHDTEMIGLVKNARNLERISLKFSSIECAGWLKMLKPPLKSLSLEMYEFLPEYLIEGIINAKATLEELKFVSCECIRSCNIERIVKEVPNLARLTLAGGFSDFGTSSLMPITRLQQLTHLDLDNTCYISDQFLETLAESCPNLISFRISGIDHRFMSNRGLNLLAKFTGLKTLAVASFQKLTDAELKLISNKLKKLTYLDVMGCNGITDAGCQSIISNCLELETLDVSGCSGVTGLTVATAAEVTKGTNRKLKIICGGSGIILDSSIAEIEVPPNIKLDRSSSIMSPPSMWILDENELLDDEFRCSFDEIFDFDDCEYYNHDGYYDDEIDFSHVGDSCDSEYENYSD